MIEFKGNELLMQYASDGCSIIELGNQIMNLEKVQDISAKEYYSKKGYKHTSIDINGKDGSLLLDLSKPIELKQQADIVTDFGTTEHVSDLFNCLLNVFNFCKEGGIIIHKNPKTKNFLGHGYHYFTIDFWVEYAKLTKMHIVELFEYPIYHNTKDGWEVIAILKKTTESVQPIEEGFEALKKYVFKV